MVAADLRYCFSEVLEFLNAQRASFIGTHKRGLDYPFVFGKGPVTRRHKGMQDTENGPRAIYSTTKKGPKGSVTGAIIYGQSARG